MLKLRVVTPLIALTLFVARPSSAGPGVLVLAHGGSPEWNARVTTLVAGVDAHTPAEVAFGMATRANIQDAVDRLVARGVTEIVAVPLFVSSWSTVVTSTEYLLGQRKEAPAALAIYAKMSHGSGAPSGHDGHHNDAKASSHIAADGTTPVTSPVPIRMTPALNDHPIVADILASRARSISRNQKDEAVIVVAHGPNEDADNRQWLEDMGSLVDRLRRTETFSSIDYLTLRDDAPKPVRDQATAELRALVTTRTQEGKRILIVPLLVSFGGIDKGLRQRLEGVSYTMPEAALMPDDRLVTWVLAMAGVSER